jgi:hypothetical protein
VSAAFERSAVAKQIQCISMPMPLRDDSRAEYVHRREMRTQAAARQEQYDLRIAMLRLLVVIAAAGIAWISLRSGRISLWWLMLPSLAFLSLLILHERIRQARRRLDRAAAYYGRGIDRIDDRWAGGGQPGLCFGDKSHVYADDLDIFGKGSLFELLCAARTRVGEATLASWLTNPAEPDGIRARQEAIGELRGQLDLRENLAVVGDQVLAGVNPEALVSWGTAPPLLRSQALRVAAAVLALSAVISLVAWSMLDIGQVAFFLVALSEGILAFSTRRSIGRVIEAVERPGQDLGLLAEVLGVLERERFAAPRLVELRHALDVDGLPPSRQIARLNLLITMRRQLFRPLAALLLWDLQMAFAIEAWRRKSGPAVARWLEVVGEMEALCSLSAYAYEHPRDPFPEIELEGPCFSGVDLGHPLLPERSCIRNNIRLDRDLRVLVVSGSNMSGKSTLLRTIGINAALALAGAPVRALQLRISPLSIGASIQRRDSLQEGTSRFYAELMRLRQLVDLTMGTMPLLFLLDELLHGTNSHDRSIGAEALVKDLVGRGAIGLLTTHDLALAHIAEVLAPRAENVHFEDFIDNGRLAFDYRLRPGIVRKSNALELMRSVGLLPFNHSRE